MKNQILRKYRVFLLILSLLGLSMIWMGGAQAQEAPPPTVERYLEPLPLKQSNTPTGHDGVVPRQLAGTSSEIADSELVVFQSLQNNNDWNIYTVNSQGEWNQLSSEPSNEIHPRLNRGANKVVFASDRTGRFELFLLNLDGSGLVQLTNTGVDNLNPAWSWDGNRIAFQSYRDGQAEIYVMDSDGNNLLRLTANTVYDGQPVWSPDGSQIAYVSQVGGYSQVWVMNANGTNAHALTSQVGIKPTWSPDGGRIAYAGDQNNDGWLELWMVNADGSDLRGVLTYFGQLVDIIPQSWSPDGRYIAFSRISYVYYEEEWYWEWVTLEAMDPTTGNSFQLPNQGTEWNPDWQTYDTVAPTVSLAALPDISPSPFKVSWSSVDEGGAESIRYQLQVREGDDGPWTDWQIETGQAEAMFTGVGGRRYAFRVRAHDRVFNWASWPQIPGAVTTVESWPPSSHWEEIPRYSRHRSFNLHWSGSDIGGSEIESYDAQVRRVPDTTWHELFSNHTGNYTGFEGQLGATYEFRLRARDRAGNTEPWPASGIRTTLYSWLITGTVVDNAQAPITGATFTSSPSAFEIHEGPSGDYTAYVAAQYNNQIGVLWQKQGYGAIPLTSFARFADAQHNVVLPPADNLLVNSHFEANSLNEGWQISGSPLPKVDKGQFHTGQASVMLGCPVLGSPVKVAQADSIEYQLAVDPTGKLHVLWNDYGQAAIYYSQRQADATWLAPEKVVQTDIADFTRLQLVIDAGGTVHAVWTWDGSDKIYYKHRSAEGVWSDQQLLSPPAPDRYNTSPQIATDSNGRVHAIWLQHQPEMRVVYASRSISGEWSAPIELSNALAEAKLRPLVVGDDGTVQIVWFKKLMYGISGIGDRLIYRRLRSDGIWEAEQVLWEASRAHDYFSFQVADVDGRLSLAWREETGGRPRILFLQQDPQGNWGKPEEISSLWFNVANLTATAAGDVVIVLQESGLLTYVDRRQGVWSQPAPLSSAPNYDEQIVDSVVDDRGAIHLVWNENDGQQATLMVGRRNPDGSWLPARKLAQSGNGVRQPQLLLGSAGAIHMGYASWQDLYVISTPISSGGSSVLAQPVTIPSGMNSPVLSFLYLTDGFHPQRQSQFRLEVSDSISTTTLSSVTANSNGWTHEWFDMSDWQSRPITIALRLDQEANQACSSVLLDEVTLGSAYPDFWISGSNPTAALPGDPVQYTITYGNRGGGKSAGRLSATLPSQVSLVSASPTAMVNGKTLTWDLEELAAHAQPLQIVIDGAVDTGVVMMTHLKFVATVESTLPEQEKANNQMELLTFVGHQFHLPIVHHE